MEKILEIIANVNNAINSVVWGWPMIILILGTGILLTIRTRFLQIRKFGTSWDPCTSLLNGSFTNDPYKINGKTKTTLLGGASRDEASANRLLP